MQIGISNDSGATLGEMLSRVAALEREARRLREDIGKLQSATGQTADHAPSQCLPEIVRITEEMFPGPVFVEMECDPEDPDVTFLVLNVSFRGNPKQAVDKRIAWHQRVSQVRHGNSQLIRLCIYPT